QLAALLAHTEDGRLSYNTCCCFIGIPTADHALKEAFESDTLPYEECHIFRARQLPYAEAAEREFCDLGASDHERREALLPVILEEMTQRAAHEEIPACAMT